MGDLPNFERGQIVGAHLAVTSVTKTATLFGVQRTTVSKVMSAYTNHGKPTSAKKSERKSTVTEDVLQEAWHKIPLEIVQNLHESIPKRIAAVLKAKKGGPSP
jgi:IS30 family transposase